MILLNKFFPKSDDPFLKKEEDMALAKFGHLNYLLKYIPDTMSTTSAFSVTSNTVFANVTELSKNVEAGGVYSFRAVLPVTVNATPGSKVAIGGTSTWTSINATAVYYTASAVAVSSSTTATPGTTIGGAAAAHTLIVIEGTVVVANPGTLTVMFAQQVSNATASVVLANASFTVTRVS
jgi:hypothetical protein